MVVGSAGCSIGTIGEAATGGGGSADQATSSSGQTDTTATTVSSGAGSSGQGGSGTQASSASSTSASTGPGGGNNSAAQLCVDKINEYRATLGLPPYARWTDAEMCSDGEAQSDSISMTAHGAFGTCSEWAQNECPGWGGTPDSIIGPCLDMMWAEGPGADFSKHGHYINMSSMNYTQVACGFWVTPQGSVWAVQNFK